MRPRVVVTDFLTESRFEEEVLGDIADVSVLEATSEEELLSGATEADALIVFHEVPIGPALIERLDRCLGVVRVGVGFDNVDRQAAGARGILVCNVPDYGTEEVADHTLMLLLAVARRLVTTDQSMRKSQWQYQTMLGAPRLRGQTLGLVGCGRIGTAVALRARAFGMRVVFFDPYKPAGYEKALGVERTATLEELLPQSNFLSVHCPASKETRHLIDRRAIDLLPVGSYLINTARGAVVEHEAILAGFASGRLVGAGLDVFETEPLVCEELRQDDRVIMTPHAAFYSVEAFPEMRRKAALEVRRFLEKTPAVNVVNRHFLVDPRAPLSPKLDGEP
ncbi:D-3-phosphoglycerate dehydrogenase [Planctomycetes bacterium Pan216]|uniref:D-3-phosphoglycerate dehydrogenase n=1 Tax=Kolteria novifilia TaxID=2527975 RepID=A0A518AWX8_9BACT|nr:D-3-phosphoglycerate dehydrogenase [Planctomycetes bacterium Pan216]